MLKVSKLGKKFANVMAVDNLSFEVEKGEIFGLLGENGAGKTTTLRSIATMLKPTSGSIEVCGYDTQNNPNEVRGKIGILFGGETGLYDRLTVYENIQYFGELNDMKKPQIKERIDYLAEIFEMKDFLNRRAIKLSKGMKQKASIARAIVHDPDLMLLDEPTSGLDVGARKGVHEFIYRCKKDAKMVVLSSHEMDEVEKLCDRVGIIHKGKLMELGKIEQLKEKYEMNLEDLFMKIVGGGN